MSNPEIALLALATFSVGWMLGDFIAGKRWKP